ncbi:MAG: hypothetical protein NTY38_04625, partial [Acidobacteria bacterium]|nr:hypothetical protein [Acidobacteriota bacterium]
MVRAARVFEWLVLLVAGCLLAWLLLLPPFIGIADNRDFAKVLGRFCLGPAPGPSNYFLYFEPDYVWNQAACWLCEVRSSELGLAAIAVAGSKLLGGGLRFDIRWLGAVHAVLFLLALAVALRATRAWPLQWRTPFAGLLLVIYLDVCYSAYFNSVYTDAAAILGFLLALAAAAALLTRLPGRWSLACFTFGMLLFAGSKAQHALTGPLAAAFLLWMAKRHRPIRLECAVSAAVILGVSVFSVAQTPKWYRGQALFNAVFFQIAKESPNPARTLSDLRLDSSYLAFVGRHAFMQETSALSNDWMARFSDRLGHGGLAGYYLRHPGLALRHLDDALRMEAPVMRPVNLSNFRRVDGQAAGA